MARSDSRIITHAYGQSSTPLINSKECFTFLQRQSSILNLYSLDSDLQKMKKSD